MKRTLRPEPMPDPDDDVVETLAEAFLDVDVALERAGDRRGEIAAGELLGPLVELEVPIGDIDGLVRHGHIVTFILQWWYACQYTYIVKRRKRQRRNCEPLSG